MKRRSKRIGGLHPENLRNYLFQMKSGIGTKDQASYIAEGYGYALSDEEKKANEMGQKTAYPLERRGREKYEHAFRARGGPHYAEERFPRSFQERVRRGRGEGVSRGDVREMVEDTLDRIEQKREREEVLRSMGSRITRIERDMDNIPNQISSGISKILEKSKEAEKPKEITKADINNMALNLEKKYIEKDFERSIKESREREKEFRKAIESLSEERNKLLKKLASRRPTDLSGYQSDSGRVIGEAVSGLKDVIKTRQPVKIAVEGLPRLLYPTTFAESEKRPVMKEEKIVGGGVSRFLEKDYVAENEV